MAKMGYVTGYVTFLYAVIVLIIIILLDKVLESLVMADSNQSKLRFYLLENHLMLVQLSRKVRKTVQARRWVRSV